MLEKKGGMKALKLEMMLVDYLYEKELLMMKLDQVSG